MAPVLTTGVRRKKPLKELLNGAKLAPGGGVGAGGGVTPPITQHEHTRKRPFREPSDAGSDDTFNEMKKIHSDTGKSCQKSGEEVIGKAGFLADAIESRDRVVYHRAPCMPHSPPLIMYRLRTAWGPSFCSLDQYGQWAYYMAA